MILLDTHALVWLRLGSDRLGPKARRLIDEHWQSGQVYVSSISFWEVAMLEGKGRLKLSQDIGAWYEEVLEQGLEEIPLSGRIGIRAAGLANLPADPADRIIVATALDGYQLVTADREILRWTSPLNRFDAGT
ncbi:type II toxin-antitoxin system VapC family toxin [Candidatus Saccharibacteria bacterium]|nr:type II toxin-antitoxin system VapC family toxin [Candidatus Saccharibacteria bacterium]